MNLDLFWVHKSALQAVGADVGFSTFSPGHLVWLAVLTVGIVWIVRRYARGGAVRRDNMRKVMAVFIILFEIMKQCVMALTDAPVKEYLPLEICSFAEVAILLDAMWPEKRFLKQMLVLFFLPAALLALLFPTVTAYPLINFYTIHQFVLHGVIVAYVLALCAAGEIVPRYAGIWTSLLSVLALIALIYAIDVQFGENYMFLTGSEGNPALEAFWRISGGHGGAPYILLLAFTAVAIMHIVFVLGTLLRKCRKRRREATEVA